MTKRLQLLNLSPTSNDSLWIPANTSTAPSNTRRTAVATAPTQKTQPSADVADVEYMQVEDTAHRVYIHNLDAELDSSTEDDDDDITNNHNRVVFISDVERQLSRVPQHILTGKSAGGPVVGFSDGHTDPAMGAQAQAGELVLYGVPSSLTVPAERDSVRQAIVESRARARERSNTMMRDAGGNASGRGQVRTVVGAGTGTGTGTGIGAGRGTDRSTGGMQAVEEEDEEEDAMDVDMEL